MFTRAVEVTCAVPTKHAHAGRVDRCLIPGVSMPLLGGGFLLERREHGTQKPGTQNKLSNLAWNDR